MCSFSRNINFFLFPSLKKICVLCVCVCGDIVGNWTVSIFGGFWFLEDVIDSNVVICVV